MGVLPESPLNLDFRTAEVVRDYSKLSTMAHGFPQKTGSYPQIWANGGRLAALPLVRLASILTIRSQFV